MRGTAALGLALLLLAPAASLAEPEAPARFLVGLDPGASLEAPGLAVLREAPRAGFLVVEATPSQAARLAALPGVRYVEPDAPVFLEGEPRDLLYPLQWGPPAIQAPAAWDIVGGSDAVVLAIVDTGGDFLHPDLVQNTWFNPGEAPLNGVDDDGNGYVDDWAGWDCAGGDNDPHEPRQSHGTLVAGVAGARRDNVLGIAGIANVKVMHLKMFNGGQGSSAAAAECIRYAVDNGARVIGMSWFASPTTAVNEAITHAWAQGALLVKSAGNQNGGPVTYPGTLPEVIAVGGLADPTTHWAGSSVGAKVELAAPAADILSTAPPTTPFLNAPPFFGIATGTSFAQPHVAGVAALVLAKAPARTNQEVRDILASTADDLGDPGRDPLFGFGRVNAEAAVRAA